ncbi:MAG: response regulator transcription factor [Bacteroidia bacterium]
MRKIKILLAEDDSNLGFVLKDNLEMNQYEVDCFENGKRALEAFLKNQYDICLLDVMMPIMDGFSLAEQIRLKDQSIPIIFLTAKGMKEDKLSGFRTGGDDYLVKPFSMEELLFRIKVFVKRKDIVQEHHNEFQFEIGTYVFDHSRLELKHKNGVKVLTSKEADLLKELCLKKNKVVTREELLKKVWGSNDYFTGRSMDVFISRLRKYLCHDAQIELMNHHGTGFRLNIYA